MIDNDYRLPSYIPPSDNRVIPGLDIDSLPPQIAASLKYTVDNGDFATTPENYSMGKSTNGTNGETSKQAAQNRGWVETPEARSPPANGVYEMLAMDCEMVGPFVATRGYS